MPLKVDFLKSCPLLLESDILSLSPHFTLTKDRLQDTVIGATHLIRQPGEVVIKELTQAVTYARLIHVAGRYNIPDKALQELLGFLNKIGALVLSRPFRHQIVAFCRSCLHLLLGIRYAPVSYRKNTNLLSMHVGILRATTPVILAAGVVAGLAAAAGLAVSGVAIGAGLYWIALFHTSILVHELAHVVVLKHFGYSANILQAGMHLGIIHARPKPHAEAISSIVGPLAGTVWCVVAGCLSTVMGHTVLALAAILIALCHSLSILPFYGDGLSLQKALQERNHIS